eukprot:CAMPEP_0168410864 /NCGR_PEP_ID=MMETSP0228-20121227/27910_1 /TAXON_ID=133427 /ORGANISM="Protoceratium reticulatum, Strain CCCM 535 (=CCMP 1889)" /LENGTH=136 /DNA_ID=CAMNT_0008424603 /DNA_START=291 /DNA_END=701 /DNA_ORIENTATION=-
MDCGLLRAGLQHAAADPVPALRVHHDSVVVVLPQHVPCGWHVEGASRRGFTGSLRVPIGGAPRVLLVLGLVPEVAQDVFMSVTGISAHTRMDVQSPGRIVDLEPCQVVHHPESTPSLRFHRDCTGCCRIAARVATD